MTEMIIGPKCFPVFSQSQEFLSALFGYLMFFAEFNGVLFNT